jgi:hypothetical protein
MFDGSISRSRKVLPPSRSTSKLQNRKESLAKAKRNREERERRSKEISAALIIQRLRRGGIGRSDLASSSYMFTRGVLGRSWLYSYESPPSLPSLPSSTDLQDDISYNITPMTSSKTLRYLARRRSMAGVWGSKFGDVAGR